MSRRSSIKKPKLHQLEPCLRVATKGRCDISSIRSNLRSLSTMLNMLRENKKSAPTFEALFPSGGKIYLRISCSKSNCAAQPVDIYPAAVAVKPYNTVYEGQVEESRPRPTFLPGKKLVHTPPDDDVARTTGWLPNLFHPRRLLTLSRPFFGRCPDLLREPCSNPI